MEVRTFLPLVLVVCVTGRVTPGPLRKARQVSDVEILFLQICQIGDTSFHHPFVCGKYLECSKGAYTERDCPAMMNFDVDKQTCEARYRLGCEVVDGVTEYTDKRKKFTPRTTTTTSTTEKSVDNNEEEEEAEEQKSPK